MNTTNLHALIDRYEENYALINGPEHYECFKWKAVRCFQDVWFSEEAQHLPFSEKFAKAMKESSVLINNSRISPVTGIVKMAEKRPQEVEALFMDVLYAPYASIAELQLHMDAFVERIEALRLELFPRYFRYQQDRHAASCYLALYAPETHFIYRFSEAEEFALHIEFGRDLGSGGSFSLANYYDMAETVVAALREHPTLLEKYDRMFKDKEKFYDDKSLHLMAFDLMYCCKCYHYYKGMYYAAKKESIKTYTAQQKKAKEERERQAKIDALDEEIHALDVAMDEYREISLIGVEVTQPLYGVGKVIAQDGNTVEVQFAEKVVPYKISSEYKARPIFEDDETLVAAFTEYGRLIEKKKELIKKRKRL